MTINSTLPPVQIGATEKAHAPLGAGCSFYGLSGWDGEEADNLLAAMATYLENGITHFDTATGYGDGESERLIGRFMAADPSRRERIFLASKANLDDISAQAMLNEIDSSRQRMQTDVIDLYYIHWPRTGQDLRPLMEGLETAKQQGKIRAIGVSNFSVEQMEQLGEVGKIDAHQLGYNLLWRFPESDLLPYCEEKGIAVVVYSALAHGILSGKYARQLAFAPDDQRWTILLFREGVWSHVYEQVEQFKSIAAESGYTLTQLALRWLLHQPSVTSVLVSAKNPTQALANARVLAGDIPDSVLDELTVVSDEAMQHIPDEGNPFGYHP